MRATVNADGQLNGATIAGYAEMYEKALKEAGYGKSPLTAPGVAETVATSVIAAPAAANGIWWLVGAVVVVAVAVAIYRNIKNK